MNDLFMVLLLFSIIGLIVGLIQPKLFSKVFKKKTNRKTVGLVFSLAIILFFILLGVTAGPNTTESNKKDLSKPVAEDELNSAKESVSQNTADQAQNPDNQPDNNLPKYQFVNSKTESDENHNKMDMYTYSGDFDIDNLKTLAQENKAKFNSGTFYYLVVFDNKDNAVFPQDPFTAEYGIEEGPQKHIKAIYTYNKNNGFSEIDYYDTNRWESVAKTVKI